MTDSNMTMLADLVAERLRPIVFEALASAARSALEEATPPPTQPLLTVGEAAKRLSCCPQTVRRLAKRGKLPAVTCLGHMRFRPDDVERLVGAEVADV